MKQKKYFLLFVHGTGADKRSDAELIAAFRKGESKCFEIIFERYKKLLRQFLYRLLRRTTFVDDALQDTFIAAWSKIISGQYHEEQHFVTWLRTIAFHAGIEMLRRENHFVHPLQMPDEPEELPGDSADELELIYELAKQLPQREREIILMHDKKDMGYGQIGKELRIRPSSARRTHERAVDALKRILAGRNKSE